ncbi:hypothetical protein BJV82DRAFT_594151 [Fennellomyces sp. T-0311]|nr:hypothetical protein BJV82DRAFT_594151 [Fennellomyces sp. T-0311]
MSVIAFNILWVICVLLLLLALFLAIRRRRMAARQANQAYAYRQQNNVGPGVRIYMPSYYEYQQAQQQYGRGSSSNDPESGLNPPPPVYKPEEAPPSYNDYRKDTRIPAPTNRSNSPPPASS